MRRVWGEKGYPQNAGVLVVLVANNFVVWIQARLLFSIRTVFPDIGIPIIKIRQSWDHPILMLGIPTLARRQLHTELGPCPDSYEISAWVSVNETTELLERSPREDCCKCNDAMKWQRFSHNAIPSVTDHLTQITSFAEHMCSDSLTVALVVFASNAIWIHVSVSHYPDGNVAGCKLAQRADDTTDVGPTYITVWLACQ